MSSVSLAVFVTNMPVPYREPVHELVATKLDGAYHVLYALEREPNRLWKIRRGSYPHSFLRRAYLPYRGRYIHANVDVWSALERLDPDVVVTSGFSPTFILAFLWARLRGRIHIPFTDGWLGSEQKLSSLHVAARSWIYQRSRAVLGASQRALELYRRYGVADEAVFQSHLCADNARYARYRNTPREFDLVFSGQLIAAKMPLFFVEVLGLIKRKKPDVRALILGDGHERNEMLRRLDELGVDHHYAGFVSQTELPVQYARARLLLFPTTNDAWGVVINEACAVGVPVITSPNTAAAGELILHGQNGYILDLDRELWAEHALHVLANPAVERELSACAFARVQSYNYEAAANGIVNAIRFGRQRTE